MSESSSCDVCYLFIFLLLCLSSFSIGQWISHYKVLALTGYLIVGILSGPWVLDIVKPSDIERLEWIDRLAMALISLTAGAELYYPHLVAFLPTLKRVVTSLTVLGFLLVFLVGWAAAPLVDYMQDVGSNGKVTLAILAAVISLASSPVSTIAIINKNHARGPYGQMALGVALIKDVVVIALYAVAMHVAFRVFTDDGRPANGGVFFLRMLGELLLTLVLGVVLAPIVGVVLWVDSDRVDRFARKHLFVGRFLVGVYERFFVGTFREFTGAVLLGLGYGVFLLERALRKHADIYIQFSLVCMTGTAVLINYKKDVQLVWKLHSVIQAIAPYTYTVFFTYIGASFDFGVLPNVIGYAFLLFATRVFGLFIGGWLGCHWADQPTGQGKLAFLAFVMQAGAGMALAKFIEDDFRSEPWATEFSTTVVFVIFVGQLVGPRTLKWGLLHFKEAEHKRRRKSSKHETDGSDSEDSDVEEDDPYRHALNYTTWRMQTGLRLLNTMNLVKESTFPVNRNDATVTVTRTLQRPGAHQRPALGDINWDGPSATNSGQGRAVSPFFVRLHE
eukprot:m.111468 g.111468  ORF g.111468 m.111468 type:complete len:560 (-) comp15385_c0_seq3:929-2608(-)